MNDVVNAVKVYKTPDFNCETKMIVIVGNNVFINMIYVAGQWINQYQSQ